MNKHIEFPIALGGCGKTLSRHTFWSQRLAAAQNKTVVAALNSLRKSSFYMRTKSLSG